MNLHYVKKTHLTDCELMICRDYFELPLDQFNSKHPTNPYSIFQTWGRSSSISLSLWVGRRLSTSDK